VADRDPWPELEALAERARAHQGDPAIAKTLEQVAELRGLHL
jgi:hypothetical protein